MKDFPIVVQEHMSFEKNKIATSLENFFMGADSDYDSMSNTVFRSIPTSNALVKVFPFFRPFSLVS